MVYNTKTNNIFSLRKGYSNCVGCVAEEARAGAVVCGGAVVPDVRPDVGSNRAAAPSAGDPVLVPPHV